MSVNIQIVLGRLGSDPETRETAGGTTVTTLSIAVNERVKRGDEWVEHTEWFRCVTFGTEAENCARYLSKGREVHCVGASRFIEFEKKDGSKGYLREIVCRPGGVTFVGAPAGSGDERRDSNGRDRDRRPQQRRSNGDRSPPQRRQGNGGGRQYDDDRGRNPPPDVPAGRRDWDDDLPF